MKNLFHYVIWRLLKKEMREYYEFVYANKFEMDRFLEKY